MVPLIIYILNSYYYPEGDQLKCFLGTVLSNKLNAVRPSSLAKTLIYWSNIPSSPIWITSVLFLPLWLYSAKLWWPVSLWWIKRDVRLDDNLALTAALSSSKYVIPLAIEEPDVWSCPEYSDLHRSCWLKHWEKILNCGVLCWSSCLWPPKMLLSLY